MSILLNKNLALYLKSCLFILTTFCLINNRIKVSDQSIKNSALEELENLPEVNLSDVYSNEKFGHDLLQFIGKFVH